MPGGRTGRQREPPGPAHTRLSTQPGWSTPSLSALCPSVLTQQRLAALRYLCYKRLVEVRGPGRGRGSSERGLPLLPELLKGKLTLTPLLQRSMSQESWAELVQVSSEALAHGDPPGGRVGHSQNGRGSRTLLPLPMDRAPGAGCGEVHQEKILDCPQAPCLPWLCDLRPGVPTDPEEEAAAPGVIWGHRGQTEGPVQAGVGLSSP